MFTGEYRHAIDAKGRVAVPARFRAELAQGAVVSRWIDSCLAIFPQGEWDRFATRVAELPVYSELVVFAQLRRVWLPLIAKRNATG